MNIILRQHARGRGRHYCGGSQASGVGTRQVTAHYPQG